MVSVNSRLELRRSQPILQRLPVAFWFVAGLLISAPAQALPGFVEVRAGYIDSDAWLLARDGRPLQRLRIDHKVRRLGWVRIEETSPALLRALLVSEDRRFYEHAGVDWSAAAASAWRNLWNTRTRGASTLTMQLVGLLDEDSTRRGRRSVGEKLGQAASALLLERHWRKDQILEAYLNLASFRGELQGVAAMSRGLFGKSPDGLDEREAALAVALLRGPNAAPATVAARACGVLKDMQRQQYCNGLDGLARVAFADGLRNREDGDGWYAPETSPNLAPHLARRLLTQPGQRLRSSLDADLQDFAGSTLQRHLRELAARNVEDGAVLVLDNVSGEVLAWIGSSGALSGAREVDAAAALRQAGSTLKPFLYALAIERRHLTAASLIDDSPLSVTTANGAYVPQNYEPQHRGWVSARMALAGSLNVPAVRTLVRVGPDAFYERLRALGFASLSEGGDYYGYSLALGSADVSLLMLANAYRTLANGGRWSPLRVTPAKNVAAEPCRERGCEGVFAGSPRQALAAAPSFVVADILADRAARAGTFGLESWLATPYWSTAKTGTSKDMRDNWCLGFSRRYTVAVWVGNASGESMHEVSGVSGAAPVWRELMDWLHRGGGERARARTGSEPPKPPAGVVGRQIRFEPAPGYAAEPPRREWFIAATETDVVRLAAAKSLARIAYPGQGTIIALDPDIPPERQRVTLQLSGMADAGWRWRIDHEPLAAAGGETLWRPRPGRHTLSLVDAAGRELESVSFEVRAMRGKLAAKSR